MQSFMYTIKVQVGLHARHAGLIVKEAKNYRSEIRMIAGERAADAKRIMALMTLGVRQGDLVQITAEGEDEDEAIRKLKSLFFARF